MSIITSLIPLPYRIGAIALILVALGAFGTYEWKKSVNNAAQKVIAAYVRKKESDDEQLQAIEMRTNTKIVTQYQTIIKTIHDEGISNVQVVTKYVTDREPLSVGWVRSHDISATGGLVDPTTASNATSSGIEANLALATVTDNYATCNETRQQLISLQDWVVQTNLDIQKQNKRNTK